jgi:Uma2 family endonuclease
VLYVSPAPTPLHQEIVGEIFAVLRAYARQHGGKAYLSPIDVVFTQTDATEPDVIYLGPDRLTLIGPKYIHGAPSLVVEVLSPASSDVDPGEKLETYAQHGVPEYWIVDPKARSIVAHAEPAGKAYRKIVASVDATIAAITLPGLRLSLIPDQPTP